MATVYENCVRLAGGSGDLTVDMSAYENVTKVKWSYSSNATVDEDTTVSLEGSEASDYADKTVFDIWQIEGLGPGQVNTTVWPISKPYLRFVLTDPGAGAYVTLSWSGNRKTV